MTPKKLLKKIIQPKMSASNSTKVAILKQGMSGEFWKIICEAMDESLEYIKKQQAGEDMMSLTPEVYKVVNELFKAKLQLIDKLKQTPENIISWLSVPDTEKKDFDPYN